MFNRYLRNFGSFLIRLTSETPADNPRLSGTWQDRLRREQFNHRVRHAIETQSGPQKKVIAGTVQLVGINKIRAAVGEDRWKAVADKANAITEATINAALSSTDAFDRRDEENYVIFFADANKQQATQKANKIVAEVTDRLIKEVPETRSHVSVQQEVHELEWAEEIPEEVSLFDYLADTLRKVRDEAAVAASQWRQALMNDAALAFSPIWRPRTHTVPAFRCLLDRTTGSLALTRLRKVSGNDALIETIAELDCVILSHAVTAIHQLVQHNATAAVAVPVNFSTLNDRRLATRYTNLCRGIPEAYRQFLLFELRAVPGGVPDCRLFEILQLVMPLGRLVVLEAPLSEERIARLSGVGFFGIAFDLAQNTVPKVEWKLYLTNYARCAKNANLQSVVYSADTLALVEMAKRAGIDYISGEGVAHASGSPKAAYHWNPVFGQQIAGLSA